MFQASEVEGKGLARGGGKEDTTLGHGSLHLLGNLTRNVEIGGIRTQTTKKTGFEGPYEADINERQHARKSRIEESREAGRRRTSTLVGKPTLRGTGGSLKGKFKETRIGGNPNRGKDGHSIIQRGRV